MKILLEELLPRLFPGLSFLCVSHEGKQDLERSIPRKLRAWSEPGVRFCVIRDNDGGDCRALKDRLVTLCKEGQREDSLVRIACQELEAWYFGAPDALAEVFGREDLRHIAGKAPFRDPDGIPHPARKLAELVEVFQKVAGARRMGKELTRDNRSRSYQVLLAGIDGLVPQMGVADMRGGND